MKKFLSIIGLTGIMLFAGNAAYAVEEAPETKPVVGVLPTATGQIIPLNSLNPAVPRDTPPVFVDFVPAAPTSVSTTTTAVSSVPVEPIPAPVSEQTTSPDTFDTSGPLATAYVSVPAEPVSGPAFPDKVSCESAGHIWAGDFCYDRVAYDGIDCPRGPSGECYSEAVPNPGYVEPVPETVEPSAAPVETTALATEPVRTELAYTGAEDVLLATVGAAVSLAGVVLVRHSLKMRRKSAGYSV